MKILTIAHMDINTIGGLQNYSKFLNDELYKQSGFLDSIHPGSHIDYFIKIGQHYILKPWKLTKLKSYDLVIIHGPALHELYLPIIIKLYHKIDVVSICHGILSLKNLTTKSYTYLLYKFISRFYKVCFFGGSESYKKIQKWFHGNNFSILHAGHNFIESNSIHSLKNINNKVSFVGRLDDNGMYFKEPLLLLEAISESNLNTEIHFISPYHKNFNIIKDTANRLNIKVKFITNISSFGQEFIGYLQKTDILVLTSSLSGGFGLVLLEALNAGIPIICSDSIGGKILIENYKVGEIFEAHNKYSLSSKINKIISNKEYYIDNISKNYNEITYKYSYEYLARRLLTTSLGKK